MPALDELELEWAAWLEKDPRGEEAGIGLDGGLHAFVGAGGYGGPPSAGAEKGGLKGFSCVGKNPPPPAAAAAA